MVRDGEECEGWWRGGEGGRGGEWWVRGYGMVRS